MDPKPARWAVNRAEVAREWQWAWRDSFLIAPMWDVDGDQQAVAGGVSTTALWPNYLSQDISEIGLCWLQSGLDGPASEAGLQTDTEISVTKGSWSIMVTVNQVAAWPNGTDLEVFCWGDGWWTFRASIFDRYQVIGSYTSQVDWTGASVDTWYVFFFRSLGGDGTTNTFDVDAFQMSDGSHVWNTTGTMNQAAGTAQNLRICRARTFNTSETQQVGSVVAWTRWLNDDEMFLLARDPFGPIRPRRLTPADVTPGSDPFRTKVFVP